MPTTNQKKNTQSIDDLNSYIHVIHPSVWLLIVAMISILIGILVWSFFGHINKQVDATVYVTNDETICYINHEDSENIKTGMLVTYASTSGELTDILDSTDEIDTYLVQTNTSVQEGYYEGIIVYEVISPISFLLD